jgi:hypothetical protein
MVALSAPVGNAKSRYWRRDDHRVERWAGYDFPRSFRGMNKTTFPYTCSSTALKELCSALYPIAFGEQEWPKRLFFAGQSH